MCSTLLASSRAGQAFNTITVRVTVNSAETFGACWDSFCNKPDLFVVFYGQSATAQAPLCKSNTVVDRVSVGSPSPNDWFCGFVVQRPGKIFIGLYDGDGPNSNNTAAEQVDVAPGAELAAGVDVEIPAVANFASQCSSCREIRARWFRMERDLPPRSTTPRPSRSRSMASSMAIHRATSRTAIRWSQ